MPKKKGRADCAAEAMESYIVESGGGVSMVELERVAGEEIDTSGDLAWVVPNDSNLVLWAGMSEDFVAAIDALRERGNVEAGGANPLIYIIDGKSLNYPLARRPPASGYAVEHWLPVLFNPKAS